MLNIYKSLRKYLDLKNSNTNLAKTGENKRLIQNLKSKIQNRNDFSVILILVVGLIFRIAIAYWIYPGYDEAYYYIYSHQLDWSYFDHPLLVALSTGLGTWLTGVVNQFTIRWGALIFYTGSLWLLYLTGKRLFNPEAAKLTLIIASLVPIFGLVFGIFTLPDAPLIFFWSAALYCAAWEFFPATDQPYQPSYRLTILSVLVGFACISKYHGFILGLGLVLFCLTIPRYRVVFRSPWTGLGFILFILTLFPLWYWNLQHDWASFQFHLNDRFDEPKPFKILNVFNVFLISILTLFPPIGLLMWWLIGKTLWQQILLRFPFKKGTRKVPPFLSGARGDLADKQWLILCVSVPIIVGFSLAGGYYYIAPGWAIAGFWSPTLLLGYWAQQQSRRRVNRALKGSAIVIVTLLFLTMLHLNLGFFQKPSQYAFLGGFVSPQQDPSVEVIDIEQLQQAFQDLPVFSTALSESQFIFTQIYFMGGLIDMAIYPLKPIPVTCFCQDPRGFKYWTNQQELLGKNGLFITNERLITNPDIIERYRPYFQEYQKLGTIPIKRGGVTIENFYVYQGKRLLKVYP